MKQLAPRRADPERPSAGSLPSIMRVRSSLGSCLLALLTVHGLGCTGENDGSDEGPMAGEGTTSESATAGPASGSGGPSSATSPEGTTGEDPGEETGDTTGDSGPTPTSTETGVDDTTPIDVVVLGASTAAGKNLEEGGFSIEDSWVNRYQAFLDETRPGSVVTNLAISGYNSYHALPSGTVNPNGYPDVDTEHNVTAALTYEPDAIVVNFPEGGALGLGATIQDLLDNYTLITDTAAAQGVEVWIATTQPNLAADQAQLAVGEDLRDATMGAFGDRAIDFWSPLIDDDGSVIHINPYDDIHPDDIGHLLLFEQVQAADLPEHALP